MIDYKDIIDILKQNKNDNCNVIGRVMSHRNNKLFIDIADFSGYIQCFCKSLSISPVIGDIVYVEGNLNYSKIGTKQIVVKNMLIIQKTKSFRVKTSFGIHNKQLSNFRTLDIISNPLSKFLLYLRFSFIKYIRFFFSSHNYIEVDTPIFHNISAGASATPFKTFSNIKNKLLYLRIAPEIYLKKLIITGFNKIFEIAKCFRNEGISNIHNPEFTMLEFYSAMLSRNEIMMLFEELFQFLVHNILKSQCIIGYKKNKLQVYKEIYMIWENINSSSEIKWATYDFLDIIFKLNQGKIDINNTNDILSLCEKIGHIPIENINNCQILEDIVTKWYLFKCKEKYVHIINHPHILAPLAKNINNISIRFESFINGVEVANGFEEQNHSERQEEMFKLCGSNIDMSFLEDLRLGMTTLGGAGVGIERLLIGITGVKNIKKFIFF